MKTASLALFCLLVSCAPKIPDGARADVESIAPDEPLPFDPGVRRGVLDNGIRYFVETNAKPEKRAVLRLVVEAGSVLEDPDQLGLAHFVEHMAFNGTTHFEGNELIRYLETTGTRFGAHLNAHTSFDETVYKLQVPTDDAEVFGTAFQILEDWAHGIRFDPEEVEAERGVVLEEWRRRLGPWDRALKATLPLAYAGSPYPERLPIGTEESLLGFSRDAAVRFYEDWYRPDLMSVIAVGDFDTDQVEALIQQHFSGIEGPDDPRERTRHDIPDRREPAWTVFADPELTASSISVEAGHDWVLEPTYRQYREGFVQRAFYTIMQERFAAIARDPQAPLLAGAAGRGRRSPTEGEWVFNLRPQEGRVLEAYELGLVELERLRRHGVTQAELDRAKAAILRDMETYWRARDTTESVNAAEELVRHVTTGESVPGVELEWELAQKYVPTITAEEVQAFARDVFLPDDARTVAVVLPQKDDLPLPTVDQLKAIEQRVATMDIAPPAEEAADISLLPREPVAGTIVERRTEASVGFEVWTLSNGAEVWVKPTDFEADQVLFRARSIGGHDPVADEDYVAAATAASIVGQSGLGEHDTTTLNKFLTGHRLSIQPWINRSHEGLSGHASVDDLELLLQLAWLHFEAPRFTEQGFDVVKRANAESLRNRTANPRTPFVDERTALIWQDFPRFRPWTVETLEQMDLEKSRAFYTDRFDDASDFRFVFVGNVDPAALQPLVERYLASLPSEDQPEARVDIGDRRVTGRHERTVRSGTEPQAEVAITLHGAFDDTFVERNRLSALREVLSTRLREVLREDKGGVYGVGVNTSVDHYPQPVYTVDISFTCDPERVPELEQATFEVLEELRKAPVEAHYVTAYQNKSLRTREEQLRDNGFWAGIADGLLDDLALTGESLDEVMRFEERVKSLTPQDLHPFASRVLSTKNVIIVRRLPKGA